MLVVRPAITGVSGLSGPNSVDEDRRLEAHGTSGGEPRDLQPLEFDFHDDASAAIRRDGHPDGQAFAGRVAHRGVEDAAHVTVLHHVPGDFFPGLVPARRAASLDPLAFAGCTRGRDTMAHASADRGAGDRGHVLAPAFSELVADDAAGDGADDRTGGACYGRGLSACRRARLVAVVVRRGAHPRASIGRRGGHHFRDVIDRIVSRLRGEGEYGDDQERSRGESDEHGGPSIRLRDQYQKRARRSLRSNASTLGRAWPRWLAS